jgi:hypothetical protein
MSPSRRRKNKVEATTERPDYVDGFLAQPADAGTTEEDVAAVAKADAERAAEEKRMAGFLKTEEVFDRNAPRPSTRDTPL